ncbi:MAG: hypothetical protein U0R44_07000 [Candidatus Micrarchaeia archaeon]
MTIQANPGSGMLRLLRDQRNGLPFLEANALAESNGSRLARSREFDEFFSRIPGPPLTLSNNAWTETILAYPKPRKPVGDSIEWTDIRTGLRYVLDSQDFKGQKNIALAFDGFKACQDGKTIALIPASGVVAIERFPQESGFYSSDPLTGIPVDDGSDHRPGYPGTKHLSRDNNDQWVGPIVRSYSRIRIPDNLDLDIYACFRPSSNFGVFIAEKS